jgi:YidC/Oxa1 family membrane protein insertase
MGEVWQSFQELIAAVMAIIYQVLPNFGVTIIILTLVINIVVFPLTLKQTRSSRAMQEIQPEIKKLQKKHKDDPESLNKEMMALYRERGVNPAGCLFPMLVQFPIWIALFRVLNNPGSFLQPSTRLAQDLEVGKNGFLGLDLTASASGIMSLDGLLAASPYFLLIGLVIVSQYVQQKMLTPQTGDQDRQARQMQGMMKIMPLFFGFISYSLPAGLVVYFATSNLFRIGQQQFIFKIDGKPGHASAKKEETTEDEPGPPPKPKKPQGSARKRNRRRRK